jgi:hypothetical protein
MSLSLTLLCERLVAGRPDGRSFEARLATNAGGEHRLERGVGLEAA